MSFHVICADVPWKSSDSLSMSKVKRGSAANYGTMSTNDVCSLDVKSLIHPEGSILVLWCLGSMMEDAFKVMTSWGFKQKQVLVWVKTKKAKVVKNSPQPLTIDNCLSFGMGRLFRQTHEIALIGISDTKIYKLLKNKSQRSVVFDENKGHSKKPESVQDSLELMFSTPEISKLELFARRQRKSWICVGNEAPLSLGEDIKYSIDKLIHLSSSDKIIIDEIVNNYDSTKDSILKEFWAGL